MAWGETVQWGWKVHGGGCVWETWGMQLVGGLCSLFSLAAYHLLQMRPLQPWPSWVQSCDCCFCLAGLGQGWGWGYHRWLPQGQSRAAKKGKQWSGAVSIELGGGQVAGVRHKHERHMAWRQTSGRQGAGTDCMYDFPCIVSNYSGGAF